MQREGITHAEAPPLHRLLGAPLGLRTQVLLNLRDVDGTPERIAELLRTSVDEVRRVLIDLEAAGAARRELSHEGIEKWLPCFGNCDVKDREGDVSIQLFHWKSLEDAIRRIDTDPSTRNYQAGIFPLSPAEYESLQAEVKEFRIQMTKKYTKTEGKGRCLYQLNLNLIPVSENL